MTFAEWTSLPNLHPAVIHFPISLLAVAVALDAAALILRRQVWLERAGVLLWVLGSAAAGAAYLTGQMAGDSFGLLSPEVESAIAHHSDLAWWTLLSAAAVTALRVAVWWIARADDRIHRLVTRTGVLTLSLGVVGLVLVTADRGGTLVYRHGVAVTTVAKAALSPQGNVAAPSAKHHERLIRLEAGGVSWSPLPDDAMALGEVVEVVAEPAGAIGVKYPIESSGEGLPLRIDGRAILLLPGEFGDVQVKAVLDLSGFDGAAGVVHHYRDSVSYGSFEVARGSSRLVNRRGAEPEILGEGPGLDAQGLVTIAVSSAGSHLKGFVGPKTAAHGHVTEPPPGRTGLLLVGRGIVHVRELRVESTQGH